MDFVIGRTVVAAKYRDEQTIELAMTDGSVVCIGINDPPGEKATAVIGAYRPRSENA